MVKEYEVLGKGAFASVSAAKDNVTHEEIALKYLDNSKVVHKYETKAQQKKAAQFMKESFEREVAVHKHLGTLRGEPHYDLKSHTGFIPMELVRGDSLRSNLESLKKEGKLEDAKILQEKAKAALTEIHNKGVIHGDSHTGNFIVRKDGSVVPIDFGNSSLLGNSDKSKGSKTKSTKSNEQRKLEDMDRLVETF